MGKTFRDLKVTLTLSQEFLDCGPKIFLGVFEIYLFRVTVCKIFLKKIYEFIHFLDFDRQ